MSQIIEQRIATLLGNFGLLPFFALAAGCWVPGRVGIDPRLPELLLIGYAAVVLSFIGALHWGFALATPQLNKSQSWNALGWSVIPALLGWLALALALAGMAPAVVFVLLIVDFVLCRITDGALLRLYPAAPPWFSGLRTRLTILVCIALAIAFLSQL